MPLSTEEIHQFYTFTPKLPPLGDGGHFLSPHPTDATYQIWLRLAQWFLRRCKCMTDDDVCQPIVIGHLSYLGDLKIPRAKSAQFM